MPPGPGTVAVVVKPIEPINPGGGGPPTNSQEFTVEALPGNEHKSSVRVEVVNAFEGAVSSDWATYHLVCVPGSHRPGLLQDSGSDFGRCALLCRARGVWLIDRATIPVPEPSTLCGLLVGLIAVVTARHRRA